MDAVLARLDQITKSLNKLETNYSIIREEILGVGASDASKSQLMGILEKKTLREIVEETQFQVNAINRKIMNDEKYAAFELKPKLITKLHQSTAEESFNESEEESLEEFPVVQIERKTIQAERRWMKKKFNEMKTKQTVADGESLGGTTVEAISSSTALSADAKSCITIKLSNFLDSALSDPQHYIWSGSRNSGPSRIVGHQSEIISFNGDSSSNCDFLLSFAVSRLLRLFINCGVYSDGQIYHGIGFAPADIPTNKTIWGTLIAMPALPDVWMSASVGSFVPLERFVSLGNLLVRGQMSLGVRSVVHIEILEIIVEIPRNKITNQILDGKSFKSQTSRANLEGTLKVDENDGRFCCNIEIVNCLNVTLRNKNEFYCNCEKNNFLAFEILPFQREKFYGQDKTKVEAMFSYEIDSTDLAIVVGFKVGRNLSSFASAFVQIPAVNGAKELDALMDSNQWKTHEFRKYAKASEGVQLIRIRNLRAEVSMSEGEMANLKIRVFAV